MFTVCIMVDLPKYEYIIFVAHDKSRSLWRNGTSFMYDDVNSGILNAFDD